MRHSYNLTYGMMCFNMIGLTNGSGLRIKQILMYEFNSVNKWVNFSDKTSNLTSLTAKYFRMHVIIMGLDQLSAVGSELSVSVLGIAGP